MEAGLNTTGQFEQATYTKSDAGVAVASWAEITGLTSLAARIQPVEQVPEVEQDRDRTRPKVRIILDSEPDLSSLTLSAMGGDVRFVEDVTGNAYLVERFEQSSRIDVLPAVEGVAV
jgi:hypothetical protein